MGLNNWQFVKLISLIDQHRPSINWKQRKLFFIGAAEIEQE
jgi:hypothetical protein